MRLTDAFENLFVPLRGRSRSASTLKSYRHSIRAFSDHLGRDATLADLDDLTVARFLQAYSDGRSPATIERHRVTLLGLWRWLIRRGLVEKWPDIAPTPVPLRIPEAWSREQIERLFATIDNLPGMIGTVRACDWWSCLHWIAWDTGERIGAIVSLEHADVCARSKTVRFRAESRKGGRADMLAQVSSETLQKIRTVKSQANSPLVLPWPYSRNYLWYRYDQVLRAAGLPANRRSKFHRLRRSVASHLEANGHDATAALGHASRKVTQRYLDPRIVRRPATCDRLFRPR